MAISSFSPLPPKKTPKVEEKIELSFPEAIQKLIGGAKIRRLEWSDGEEFCLLKDNFLMIHRKNKFHTWIVSEGDMTANDWVVI